MSARIIFLNLCLAILFASQAKAQIIVSDGTKIQNDTIGEAQILVQYETRCISNTEKPENVTEETMMLEVGKNLSKFYSYTKYVCDSVLAVDFANKASQETINEHLKQYGTSKQQPECQSRKECGNHGELSVSKGLERKNQFR